MYFFANIIYVHGKIHALFNSLFRKKDYNDLINSSNFASLFPGLKFEFTRERYTLIKEVLFRHQIEKVILLASACKYYHQLFIAFLQIYELNNIKILLAKSFGRSNIIEQWNDIHPFHTFDRNLLQNDLTPESFSELTKGTYIQNIIQEGENLKYEIIESKLDFHAINTFLGFAKYLHGLNKKVFQEFMARKLIITRLIWRDRLYRNYKWPAEKVEEFIDEIFNQLSGTDGLELYKEMILKEIDQIFFKNQKKQGEDYNLQDIEYKLDKYFWRYVYKHFNADFHHIYSVMSYLWLLKYQIENVNKIVEGIRCNADPEVLIEKIICEE